VIVMTAPVRECVICGKPVPDPEPGIDYCSDECFREDLKSDRDCSEEHD
jgi:predicted nucleic acid-binding Zn ribbon protein